MLLMKTRHRLAPLGQELRDLADEDVQPRLDRLQLPRAEETAYQGKAVFVIPACRLAELHVDAGDADR